jgi:hypothetical protein
MTVPTAQLQTAPYLRDQRKFPLEDTRDLARQMDQAYIDIAGKVNVRSIGINGTNFPIITGDSWFLAGEPNKQQSLRQIYQFTSAGTITHGINTTTITSFTPNTYGTFTDGINWYGAIFASSTALAGQVSFWIDNTNIHIINPGPPAPAITSGIIILEWISQF